MQASNRNSQHINRTPLLTSSTLNEQATAAISHVAPKIKVEVALKCENFQVITAGFNSSPCSGLMLWYLLTQT